jgi:hypothetical protein
MTSPNGFPLSSRRFTRRNDCIRLWGTCPIGIQDEDSENQNRRSCSPSNLGEKSPVGGAQSKRPFLILGPITVLGHLAGGLTEFGCSGS